MSSSTRGVSLGPGLPRYRGGPPEIREYLNNLTAELDRTLLQLQLQQVGPVSGPTISVGASQTIAADTYVFALDALRPGLITGAISQVASLTETYTVTIDGVAITGLVAITETLLVPTLHLATPTAFAAGLHVIAITVSGSALGFGVTLQVQ